MFSKLLFAMTLVAFGTNAQTIPGLTACVLACIQPAAAQNGCASFTDLQCVCTSAQFHADAAACLTEHCSPADVRGAISLHQGCTSANLTATGSATPRPVSFTTPLSSTTGAAIATTSIEPTTTGASVTTTTGASATALPPAPNGAPSLSATWGMGTMAVLLAVGYDAW